MENTTGAARCQANDRELIQECMTTRKYVIRKCHAGFYDAIIPVWSAEQYIGALCIGQFLHCTPAKKELKLLQKKLSFLNLTPAELKKYYTQTPKLSTEQSSGLLELIQMLGEHIAEFYQHVRFWDSAKSTESITLAQQYIRQHYSQPLTITGIARAVGMSKSHFLHKFTAQIGVTPMVFLNNFRAEQATELLTHSTQNIAEIADICGFGNIYAINRYFKKIYGCTPTEYRQIHTTKQN